MEAGEASLGMNDWLATFAGPGWLEMFFQRVGEKRKEWVMGPDKPSLAARCTRCGGVWVVPRTPPV
jgi:hypothetical protein